MAILTSIQQRLQALNDDNLINKTVNKITPSIESINNDLVHFTPVQCNILRYTEYISTVKLTDTTALVCYTGNSDNNYLYAQVLTVSDDTIIDFEPVQCNNYNISFISTVKLNDSNVLVCYMNNDDRYLYSQILTVSDDTVIASEPIRCNYHTSHCISTVKLSDTTVLVCYKSHNNDDYLYSQILKISGTTIKTFAPEQCNRHYSEFISTTKLTNNTVLVCYSNKNDNNHLYSQILTISDNDSITAFEPVRCNRYRSKYISTVKLSDTTVLVYYTNYTNNKYIYSQMLTVSNNTITASKSVQWNTHRSRYISTVQLTDTTILVFYKSYNNYLYSQVLTLSDTIIAISKPVRCNYHSIHDFSTVKLTDTTVLVCYGNISNNGYLYTMMVSK